MSDNEILRHLDEVSRPTGLYLNIGAPGDTANCAKCHRRVHYDLPLIGDTGGWRHLHTLTAITHQPIRYDHPAQPDPATVDGSTR